jgi:hypothetical protein
MTELPDELRALGRGLAGQPRADLAGRVLAELDAARPHTPPRWRRWLATLVALLAALAVSAVIAAPVRAAIVHAFRFGGVEVRQEPGPTPAASPLLPGEHATDLTAAAREVGFTIRTPRALGSPDSVTVADGRVVSLFYTGPDGPVRLDEFAGDLGVLWEKYMATGGAQRMEVNGHAAYWFDQPVTLLYAGPDGTTLPGSARQTNAMLIWTDGPVTLRLDGIRHGPVTFRLDGIRHGPVTLRLDGIRPLDAALSVARTTS